MTSVGRNGPCPCGSGRKYRDCCSDSDDARRAILMSTSTRESSISKLLAFAFQPAFDSDHAVAEIVFWGNLSRSASPHDLQWLMDSEEATIKYNSWFLFDWDIDGAGTVAELFLDDQTVDLSPLERQFLARLAQAHLRLYEVEAVDRGHGLKLLDLWTGARLFVIERTATKEIVTWDLLGARVAPDGLGGNVFEGGLYLYPADMKDQIAGHFRRLYRRHQRKFPGDTVASFFQKHGMVFHHLWLNLVAFPEPPQVVTAEGDPLMFCRSVFDTRHPEQVRAAVAAHPDIRAVDDGRFSWRESTPDGERELGTWTIEGQRIVFETTSQERAARGRTWLDSVAPDLVRYRATALETLEQTINELRRHRPRKMVDAPPPPETGAVRELFDRHYQNWLDRPDPALGNRTPRAAARAKLWRPRLVDLLKQMENGSERGALAGRPSYDFQWIWKELGLERP
jgi:SEC-C motif